VTATVLKDAKMLVAGGTPATVLYDSTSDTWAGTGSMIPVRFDFTSTLLPDGKVLAVGGSRGVFPNLALTSAELYDPSTGIWTATASMVEGRERHIAILLLDGTVLVVGGSAGDLLVDAETGQYVAPNLASAERYGPGSGS
jgi:hypothetical protein